MERKFSYADMVSQGNLITPKVEIEEVETEVLSNLSSFKVMVNELYEQYADMIDHRGGRLSLTSKMFHDYCYTLVYHRCVYCNTHDRDYVKYTNLTHPHIIGVMIAGIGKATNVSIGLSIKPAVPRSKDGLLSEEEMFNVDRQLRSLSATFGLSFGTELIRDKLGDFKIMSFSWLEDNSIRSRDDSSHPTQALIAMLAGINLAESVLVPRITYISSDRIELLSRAAASFDVKGSR